MLLVIVIYISFVTNNRVLKVLFTGRYLGVSLDFVFLVVWGVTFIIQLNCLIIQADCDQETIDRVLI